MRYPDEFFRLAEHQKEALRKRYGAVLDLRNEFFSARDWLREVHTSGAPYKKFVRFFWNWCRREVEFRERHRAKAEARIRDRNASHAECWERAAQEKVKPLPREQYEALLDDEIPAVRQAAREGLERYYGGRA